MKVKEFFLIMVTIALVVILNIVFWKYNPISLEKRILKLEQKTSGIGILELILRPEQK